MPENNSTNTPKILQVFFDGGCPICRKEISTYADADKAGLIDWVDVSNAQIAKTLPIDREKLLARFHVRNPNGHLISGVRAFILLWRQLPKWRWLGLAMSTPGIPVILELVYRGFLKVRPAVQRISTYL